jgi:hypothetical protein
MTGSKTLWKSWKVDEETWTMYGQLLGHKKKDANV